MKYICPVCGYKGLDEPAYANLNTLKDGSFNICSCCRFQFGVDDDIELGNGDFLAVKDTHTIYRDIWLKFDAPVFSTKEYPIENQKHGKVKREFLVDQLKTIGVDINEQVEK